KEAMIPDIAAGITTFHVTSSLVEPKPSAPSLIEFGTELIASSDSDATIGIIIIPITIPGLRILVGSRPGMIDCKRGVTNVNAKKPYTIVGIPARISSIGFKIFLTRSEAYSLK